MGGGCRERGGGGVKCGGVKMGVTGLWGAIGEVC